MPRRKKQHYHTRRRHHDKPGVAPGTLVAPPDAHPSTVSVIAYGEKDMVEKNLSSIAEIQDYIGKWPVTWINIDGLADVGTLAELGEILNFHPLALEDVLNQHHRAKAEDFGDHIFMITHMMQVKEETLESEQLSLFIGKNFIITLQERPDGDVFNPVRERLRRGEMRRIRTSAADYLAYSILDAVIDGYFPVLEFVGDWISNLEDQVVSRPDHCLVTETHVLKRNLRQMRQAMWPLREAVNTLHNEHPLIGEEAQIYLRDCQDHIINVLDLLEIDRERASGLVDIYLSSVNNQMNETMKILTIISTIFIPLSFIAGVYGMNFDRQASPYNMPELGWFYGYPFALGLMALVFLMLLVFFIRHGWIRSSRN
ncbi:MAG: magnesium/cobalt transporter CorA [Micavibrio aeruginosavorus]|uniref:Magnesium transport protein CorA n=1 Tax=Micavibrio aeruginosavorus TaxID=349221 RepID=A0A7T5R2G7_9BACT|nr:MAG: magnesium/cobalt transporter CorA [Micavibrio aeruginosavorus]